MRYAPLCSLPDETRRRVTLLIRSLSADDCVGLFPIFWNTLATVRSAQKETRAPHGDPRSNSVLPVSQTAPFDRGVRERG